MIQNSAAFPQREDWKHVLSQSIRTVSELFDFCAIEADPKKFHSTQRFPLRVTRFYASLIEKGNIDDPLLRQVLPSPLEQQDVDGYSTDAVGDQSALVAPGLIHKYPSRVLMTLTGACAINCRYCFRRHFPYSGNSPDTAPDGPALGYISKHPEIREVVLSGGDPLMVGDDRLAQLIEDLNDIPHIHLLRIHSRLMSVLPERLSDPLCTILQRFKGNVTLVSHINHANEIHPHNRDMFKRLQSDGFGLFNQSVLLRHINDNAETLSRLSYRLFDCGITPYYLNRLDKVQGAAHFDISMQQACTIHSQLRGLLPGYLVPQLVEDIPGRNSKTPVQCQRFTLSSGKLK